MKRCPSCNRTYTDLSLNFCLEDGTPLAADVPPPSDPNATMRYPAPRDTSEPPPTEIYHPAPPVVAPRPPVAPPPPPTTAVVSDTVECAAAKKSNAVWWILGGVAALAVIGIGLAVMLIAIASMGTNTNNSNSTNINGRENRNSNVAVNTNTPGNTNSATLPTSIIDNFSEPKWGVGDSKFGRIWYADDEYHMSSKERTFVVMYAPSDDYSTENATVKVTARSVDGKVPSAGFGLMVHCAQSKDKHLEDYALLISLGDDPSTRS